MYRFISLEYVVNHVRSGVNAPSQQEQKHFYVRQQETDLSETADHFRIKGYTPNRRVILVSKEDYFKSSEEGSPSGKTSICLNELKPYASLLTLPPVRQIRKTLDGKLRMDEKFPLEVNHRFSNNKKRRSYFNISVLSKGVRSFTSHNLFVKSR
jgi:hypothetical protein